MHISCHVVFFENSYYYSSSLSHESNQSISFLPDFLASLHLDINDTISKENASPSLAMETLIVAHIDHAPVVLRQILCYLIPQHPFKI